MIHVEVISTEGFGYILISSAKIPLAHSKAGIVAGRGSSKQAVHEQNPAAHAFPMKIAADAGLLHLYLTRTERFRRADDGVIDGLIEIFHVVRVEADFRREEF